MRSINKPSHMPIEEGEDTTTSGVTGFIGNRIAMVCSGEVGYLKQEFGTNFGDKHAALKRLPRRVTMLSVRMTRPEER